MRPIEYLCQALGEAAVPVCDVMKALYGQPWRKYHNLDHIEDVYANHEVLKTHWGIEPRSEPSLVLAIGLHDIIYVPGGFHSELASATLCQSLALPESDVAAELIIATYDHNPGTFDQDATLLCDADLLGLAGEAAYPDIGAKVKEEVELWYEAQGDELEKRDYLAARKSWIESFLARPLIYHGPRMTGYERKARANLTNELKAIEVPA